MREEIEQTFNEKLLTLDPNDPRINIGEKISINIEKAGNLDALESMNKYKKK